MFSWVGRFASHIRTENGLDYLGCRGEFWTMYGSMIQECFVGDEGNSRKPL